MCLPLFSPFLYLLHLLFVLVFFLFYWSHDLNIFVSTMLETLTFHWCYCILECNNVRPVIDISALLSIFTHITVFSNEKNLPSCSRPKIIASMINFPVIISIEATSLSVVHYVKSWDEYNEKLITFDHFQLKGRDPIQINTCYL